MWVYRITQRKTEDYITDRGTQYSIEKWVCPICNQEKSTLVIDGEWCHGDSEGSSHSMGKSIEVCAKCILKI